MGVVTVIKAAFCKLKGRCARTLRIGVRNSHGSPEIVVNALYYHACYPHAVTRQDVQQAEAELQREADKLVRYMAHVVADEFLLNAPTVPSNTSSPRKRKPLIEVSKKNGENRRE